MGLNTTPTAALPHDGEGIKERKMPTDAFHSGLENFNKLRGL